MRETIDGNIYCDRSYSSVILNRRNNAVGPTGIYTCAIPSEADSSATSRTLYIGVYGSTPGPLTVSLSYDPASYTLTCVSSGGPVNTVTWRRNGAAISYQLAQSLVDGETSTYHNLLTATSGDVEDYIGSFSCTVINSRGSSSSQTINIDSSSMSILYALYNTYAIHLQALRQPVVRGQQFKSPLPHLPRCQFLWQRFPSRPPVLGFSGCCQDPTTPHNQKHTQCCME